MKITPEKVNEIVDSNYENIYYYCRIRMEEQDAKDITQEVFLALLDSYKKVEFERVRQWLYNTAYYMVVDYYKEKERRKRHFLSLEAVAGMQDPTARFIEELVEENLPENVFSEEQIFDCRAKVLMRLSDRERELYENVFVEKKSYAGLAEQLGISESTLRKRISRLTFKIRKIVKKIMSQNMSQNDS